jgi:hypothetical protein
VDAASASSTTLRCSSRICGLICGKRMQADSRPAATDSSGGFPASHSDADHRQRGEKLQHPVTSSGDGILPGMVAKWRSLRSIGGSESNSPSE